MDIPSSPTIDITVNEIRSLIKVIQDYLSAPDQTEDDDIRECWRQYCQLCQYVNHRLDRTGQLLERGEWLEAVRSAELEPAILESVSVIDFEHRAEWEQMGTDLGWDRLVPIAMDACERLNSAWENRRRLKPLLREHIRLALCGQEFLGERLRVMRELFHKDKFSTFWRDDIQTLERVYVPQLLRSLKGATQCQDANAVRTVLSEIQETEWTLKLTSAMQQQVDQAEILLLEQQEIPELADALQVAYQQQDEQQALQLIDLWHDRCQRYSQLQPQTDVVVSSLVDSTQQAVNWAQDVWQQHATVQQWYSAVQELEDTVRQNSNSWPQVKVMQQEVLRLESLLPEQAVDFVTAERARAASKRCRTMYIVNNFLAAAGVVVGIGVAGFLLVMVGRLLTG